MRVGMRVGPALAAGLCLLALSAPPARAQSTKFEGGIEAAVDISKLSPKPQSTSGTGTGVMFGVYAIVPFLNAVAIQPELVYIQKRSSLTSTTDENLDYIEIPILARMRLFRAIYMTEGVAFGFPIKAELVPSSGASTDIKSRTTSPDVGVVIGGGVPVGRLGIEFRYEGGFRSVDSSAAATIARTRTYMLLARYHF